MDIQTGIPAKNGADGSPMGLLSRPKNANAQAAGDFLAMLAPESASPDAAPHMNTLEATPSGIGTDPIVVETQTLHRSPGPEGVASPDDLANTPDPAGQDSVTVTPPPMLIMTDLPRPGLPAEFAGAVSHTTTHQPDIVSATSPASALAPKGAPDIQGLNGLVNNTPGQLSDSLQGTTPLTPADSQTGNAGTPSQAGPLPLAKPDTDMAPTGAILSGLAPAGRTELAGSSVIMGEKVQPDILTTGVSSTQGSAPAPTRADQQPASVQTGVLPENRTGILPEDMSAAKVPSTATDPNTLATAHQAQAAAMKPDMSASASAFASVFSAGVFSGSANSAMTNLQHTAQGKGTSGSPGATGPASSASPLKISGFDALSQGKATGSLSPDSVFVQPSPPALLKPLPVTAQPLSGMEIMADPGSLAAGIGQIQGSGNTHALSADTTMAGSTAKSPAMQVGLGIAKAVTDGTTRFTIRMDPPDLGRIEVKLDMLKDGRMRALIMADTPETLDLLQRDARALEKMLGESGIKTESNSLSFSLNQNTHDNQNASFADHADRHGTQNDKAMAQSDGTDDVTDLSLQQAQTFHWQAGDGLNIVI